MNNAYNLSFEEAKKLMELGYTVENDVEEMDDGTKLHYFCRENDEGKQYYLMADWGSDKFHVMDDEGNDNEFPEELKQAKWRIVEVDGE